MVKKFVSPEVSQQATEVIAHLNVLAEKNIQNEAIQTAELARTNQRLYEVLGGLYAHYRTVSGDEKLLTAVKDEMAKSLEKEKKVIRKLKTLNLFVRYVFHTDRQRTYNYVQVLKLAEFNDVAPEDFSEFVKEKGGIEKCKKLAAGNVVSTVKNSQANIYGQFQSTKGSQILASFPVSKELVESLDQSKYVFIVGKANSSGIVDVISVVPKQHENFEKWALKHIVDFERSDPPKQVPTGSVDQTHAQYHQSDEHFTDTSDCETI